MSKSHEIFQLTSLCHISIRVEAYKGQCYNCEQQPTIRQCLG
jgi:hypothetical protein